MGELSPEAMWEEIAESLRNAKSDDLWQELSGLGEYRGGDQRKNLRLAALVETLAVRDDKGEEGAAGAREAFAAWKKGPDGGGDSGHVVAWMMRFAPQAQG